MNKAELKKLIKPLVKECVQEALLEEGLLSGIVSEVVKGVSSASPIIEKKKTPKPAQKQEPDYGRIADTKKKINEHQKRLLDAIGTEAYNGVDLFEGTKPISNSGTPKAGSTDLGERDDPGVPFAGPLAEASKMWGKLV
mgnify:CR=1 FL=1|jgi:hypothetical protein